VLVGAESLGEDAHELVLVLVEVLEGDPSERRGAHHEPELANDQLVRRELVLHLLADGRVERGDRVFVVGPAGDQFGQGRVAMVLVGGDDVELGLEVAEERATGDVGRFGDVVDGGGVVPLLLEEIERGADDRLARLVLLALTAPGGRDHVTNFILSVIDK
jgi:hypothetical protein